MELSQLVAFNLALLAAMAAPGPALLLALRNAIAMGPRAGIATGAGLGIVAAGWTATALLGLDIVFSIFPWAYVTLKVGGAAYLFFVAWTLWRDARKPLVPQEGTVGRAFRSGLLVNLGNPKSVLFAAAVLVVIFPADLTPAQKAVITLNHLAVEVLVYTGFALLLSTRRARAGYLSLKPVFDRVAALVLGALGLRLLLSR